MCVCCVGSLVDLVLSSDGVYGVLVSWLLIAN